MDCHQLPYEELKTLHLEIGQLLQTRRREALEQLKAQMTALGFKAEDLTVKPVKGNGRARYQHPDDPSLTYAGKGPRPQWLKDALEAGRQMEEFQVAS